MCFQHAQQALWRFGTQPILLLVAHDQWDHLPQEWNIDGLGWNPDIPQQMLNSAKLLHWSGKSKSFIYSSLQFVSLCSAFQTSHGSLVGSTVNFGPHTSHWSVVDGASVWRMEERGGYANVNRDSVDHCVMARHNIIIDLHVCTIRYL